MHGTRAVAAAIVSLQVACAAQLPPVTIDGRRGDLITLAGEWRGSYQADSGATLRAGSILFRITEEGGSAFGDVLMIVRAGWSGPVPPDPAARDIWIDPQHANRVLTIRFVHAGHGMVFGAMNPYRDPDCGCELRTEFTGEIRGDTIAGSFTSLHLEHGTKSTGRWSVIRYLPRTAY